MMRELKLYTRKNYNYPDYIELIFSRDHGQTSEFNIMVLEDVLRECVNAESYDPSNKINSVFLFLNKDKVISNNHLEKIPEFRIWNREGKISKLIEEAVI